MSPTPLDDARDRRHQADIEAAKDFLVLADLMHGRLAAAAADQDLTAQQAHLLYLAGAGASMRDLAERLACDPSNVTGLADRLEERGLIRRRRSPTDRRITQLMRTEAGSAAVASIEEHMFADLPIYRGLTSQERRQLQGLLAKVIDNSDDLHFDPRRDLP